MAKKVLILGGGTGGTIAANRLRRHLHPHEADIDVVDGDNLHLYQPGLLFIPFRLAQPRDLVRVRSAQLRAGVGFHQAGIERVDLDGRQVFLDDGSPLPYDVLVVATGSELRPEETEGLPGSEWGRKVHTFYTLDGAVALAGALDRFGGGRLVVNIVDMPIKCPVAPLEFLFLADWYFHRLDRRHDVELTLVTPLDGAFSREVCDRELSGVLGRKGIEVVTEFNTAQVDGPGGRLVSFDGREVGFDLAVVIPLHGGAAYVERSPGLGDALGFVPTDPATLQARDHPGVFVIGDAADVAASKAGSVAHFESTTLTRNVAHHLAGEPLEGTYDGHTNCFIETGFGKAMLIDFDYDTEPVPGHYPGAVGLPLLKESRLNHLGKRAFEQLYWHALLPGRDVPGIGSAMPTRGKALAAAARTRT